MSQLDEQVELREQRRSTYSCARRGELVEPLFASGRAVNRATRRPDCACTKKRFDAQHGPRRILDQTVVVAHELLEGKHARGAVIYGLQRPDTQPLGQLLGVDAVALVGELALAADVADHDPLGMRLQQVVQPLGLRSFLERHVDPRPGPSHERQDRPRLRRHRRSHRDRPALVPYARHDRCLMHVHSEILNRLVFHGSRPFLSCDFWRNQTYRKGRAFNMR